MRRKTSDRRSSAGSSGFIPPRATSSNSTDSELNPSAGLTGKSKAPSPRRRHSEETPKKSTTAKPVCNPRAASVTPNQQSLKQQTRQKEKIKALEDQVAEYRTELRSMNNGIGALSKRMKQSHLQSARYLRKCLELLAEKKEIKDARVTVKSEDGDSVPSRKRRASEQKSSDDCKSDPTSKADINVDLRPTVKRRKVSLDVMTPWSRPE